MPPPFISTAPLKPTRLSIPTSPFSPRSPLSALGLGKFRYHQHIQSPTWSPLNPLSQTYLPSPPPVQPLQWLWRCHMCHSKYDLGITRRCLEDGHRFCSGTSTIMKRGGKRRMKKHEPCASEFDYNGWKAWGEWKRELAVLRKGKEEEGCGGQCDYPSECRWSKKLGGQEPGITASRSVHCDADSCDDHELSEDTDAAEAMELDAIVEEYCNDKTVRSPVSPLDEKENNFWSVVGGVDSSRSRRPSSPSLFSIEEMEE